MTDANRELHRNRLRSSLEAIPAVRGGSDRALDPGFQSWKSRTQQSLGVLFGEDHHYTNEFTFLNFWLPRVSYGAGSPNWSSRDEQQFPVKLHAPGQPPLSVTVINVLSQTNVVQLLQLYAEIESLGLASSVEKEAKAKTTELESEVRGEQRWPVLAKTLDGLKALGKPVYEKVAIPLLLEMLKKQAGL